jgi:hypothetical protein
LNGFHGLAGRKHDGELQPTSCESTKASSAGSRDCLFIIPAMYQAKRPARSEFVPIWNELPRNTWPNIDEVTIRR